MKRLPQVLMLIAALSLLGVFFFPLWKISLFAPQYPDGINMYIWVNKITGDTDYTLQNINILNHYIGMKYIEPDTIPELTFFPYIVAAMIFLGLAATFIKRKFAFMTWAILLIILGTLGIYDFYLWEYDYGHNLDPNAPIKIPGMVYQPPLIGNKMLLNFDASSWPHIGSLFLGLAIFFSVLAAFIMPKKKKTGIKGKHAQMYSKSAAVFFLALIASSCSTGPKPIYYSEENCASCQMTIVDQRYASQIVTTKGKHYNFDAIECMVHYMEEKDLSKDETAHLLVNTMDNPGTLHSVEEVVFIYTKALPSPMGMNITAFSSIENIPTVGEDRQEFNWKELKDNFKSLSENLATNR